MSVWSQWPTKRLGPICIKVGSGLTPFGGESVYVTEGTALIRSQNVYNGRFAVEGLAHISDEHAERMEGVAVIPDDILLNITGDSVARCSRVPDYVLPARVNQHVSIIRPDPAQLNARFLMYFLISPRMQTYMLSLAGSGGTRKALTKAMIEAFEMPSPPLEVQHRIAAILSAYDDLIENNRRRIQLLEQAARLIYQEWFVRLRFPGHEHVRVLDGVPEEWEKGKLGDILVLNYGKGLRESERIEGDVPVYGSSGVLGYHDQHLVEGPGIIVGRKGNVGSVFWSQSAFFPIDTVYYVDAKTSSLYLFHLLRSLPFQSSDGAVPGLNRSYAYSLPIRVPPKTLVDRFEGIASPIYQQILNLQRQDERLRQARDLLLPRLMGGEIEV